MTPGILTWLADARKRFPFDARLTVEVGSRDGNGNPRSLFQDATKYIGVDRCPGPNVDLVTDAHCLSSHFRDDSVDTIVCCEMLEHDESPIVLVRLLQKLLCPGGMMVLTSPGNGYPRHVSRKFGFGDYWRFLDDAYRDVFFVGWQILDLHHTADPCTCVLAQKP